jgi:4-carboxymuconolactone decarboxylase
MKSILRASLVCVVFAGSAVALTGERMAPIPLDKMSAAQRRVAEDIMAGPRGGLRGPFNAWLRSPELADRLQKVGEYLRFNTSLDKRVNEMAIIMTAQAWGSQYEWYAHAPLAIKAGLDPSIVEAIGAGKKPEKMKDDEAIVWEFTTQLRRDHSVDDAIYAQAVAKFGEQA